jgi:predicted permease
MNRLISAGEVRLALRLILKQPILSGTIVLALATGICLATMGFTFRDELVNSTLPYQAGERIARIFVLNRDGGRLDLDLQRYRLFREHAASFEHVGAYGGRPFTVLHDAAEVETIQGAWITPASVRWVDAVPLLGRTFIPADGGAGAERVALIRESFWRRRYASDAQVIGRQINVGGQLRTIVGVMPNAFEFPNSGELWLPLDDLTLGGNLQRPTPGLRVFGVLRPGVTFEAATVEVNELTRQVAPAAPDSEVARLLVRPFTADSDDSDVVMSALVFVLVMVLLVVASNVATLVFARTWARAPELAVRTALGAARGRVVGQLFVEMLLLGSIAASLGLVASFASLRYLKTAIEGWPFWVTLDPNPRIVAFVIFLTLLVSVVSGLIPALRVTRHDLRTTLQAGRGFVAGGFGRVGGALLIAEIALSVALLNGAVTMARAFNAYVNDIAALPKNQVLTAQMGNVASAEIRDKIVEAVRALPGVRAVGAGQQIPRLYPQPRPTRIEPLEGEPSSAPAPAPSHAVGNGFLEAIGARALAGRLFTPADFREGAAPVAVVNEPFVRKFFGGANPIGRRIRIEQPDADDSSEPWREIVGVVPDLGLSVANTSMAAGFYTPVRHEFLYFLAVRTSGNPLQLAPLLRVTVANIDPDSQVNEIRTLEEAGMEERVFLSGMGMALAAMGGMALLLSAVGIYALLSFMVTRRTREVGVRVALGATPRHVLGMITGRASLYLGIGGLLGSGLGLLLLEMRALLLISVPDAGVWMPSSILLALGLAGATACWIPARRALRIRPAAALASD